MMSLDEKKLKLIKVKVIETEKENIIKKDPENTIIENLRKYIEKVVNGNVN